MKNLWKMLQGHKANLGAIGWGILGILYTQGLIDEKAGELIGSILVAWTGIAIRSAWNKGK